MSSPIDMLRMLSAAMEDATRIGEFARGLDVEGGSKVGSQKAAAAAREVSTDFARHGAKLAAIRAISAFWNARLQGYDRLARAFKKNPVATSTRAFAGITLPSLLLYWVNRDDPEYHEIPQWQRDLFWLVKVPAWAAPDALTSTSSSGVVGQIIQPFTDPRGDDRSVWVRIPKPFELGLVFGTIPERIVEWLDTDDPEGLRVALEETLLRELMSTVVPGVTALEPLVENATNYSFFLRRPIVPRGLQDVEPAEQARPHTSVVARGLGRMLDYSPAKIDNLLYGYSGGLGRLATEAVGLATRPFEDVPREARPLIERLPGIRGFSVREPGEQSESIERFYDQLEEATRAKRTADLYLRADRIEDYHEHTDEHAEEIARYRELRQVADELARIRGEMSAIERAPDVDPATKAESLRRLGRSMMLLAREAIGRNLPHAVRQ